MELKMRVSKVLVTGGASGIGLGIAKALLEEGCHVCICGRNLTKLEAARTQIANDKLAIMQWDVRDTKLINEKINEAASLCGGFLDGLVNNAGVYTSGGGWAPWNETEDIWDAVWDTNLKAQVFLLRRFATYLHSNKLQGNIFCISSIGANRAQISGSYEASKYALSKMVHGHARAVRQFGIVVNGILPGVVATPMTNYNESFSNCALNRSIKLDEIVKCAMFMLSEAADICCGTMLDAGGGFFNAV